MHHMFCDWLYFPPLCKVKRYRVKITFYKPQRPCVSLSFKNRYKHTLVFTENAIYGGQWIALILNPFGFILKRPAGLHDAVICVQALKNFGGLWSLTAKS